MSPARNLWPVLGVDPGGQSTGLVLRDRDELRHGEVVKRGDRDMAPYMLDVISAMSAFTVPALVAVEDVNEPSPHMGMVALRGLLDTAQVLGAVLSQWPHAVVVPPGGHGKGPLAAYPAELVGARERSGAGRLRHARSAWDLAGAAVRQVRLADAAARSAR